MGTLIFTPAAGSGGGGSGLFLTRVIWRPGVPSADPAVETWAEVEAIIAAQQGSVIVAVDNSIAPAIVPSTASTECFGRVILTGFTLNISAGVGMTIADGGQLKNLGQIISLGIECLTTIRPAFDMITPGVVLALREGGNISMMPGSTVSAVRYSGAFSELAIFLGARIENNSGTPGLSSVLIMPGLTLLFAYVLNVGNNGPPQYSNTLFQGDATTSIFLLYDASAAPVVQVNFLGITQNAPMDWAAGVAFNDALAGTDNGDKDVQAAIDRLKVASGGGAPIRAYVYVSPAGNDITGDGSIGKPYATVSFAMSTITTAAFNNRFAIWITGRIDDPNPIVFKANVFIVATNPFQGRIASPAWSLDADWGVPQDSRGGFINCTVSGAQNWDFNAVASNEGKFYAIGAWLNNNFTWNRFSPINQCTFVNCRTFGACLFQGGNIALDDTDFGAAVTVTEGTVAAGLFQLIARGCAFAGGLSITRVDLITASSAALIGGNFCSTLTITGIINVDASADSIPTALSLLGGATLTRLTRTSSLQYASGATIARPTADFITPGFSYLDFDLVPPRPIFWTGGGWIDATGAAV